MSFLFTNLHAGPTCAHSIMFWIHSFWIISRYVGEMTERCLWFTCSARVKMLRFHL